MPKHLTCIVVVGHPLMITFIVCYVVRMLIFLTASIVAIHTTNDNRSHACLKLAEMTCRRWTRQHSPTRSPK
jgi:hypothetical protein